jgi:hypothetical protein
MSILHVPLLAAVLALPAALVFAQGSAKSDVPKTSNVPVAKFQLQVQGKTIGSADYAFSSTELGWAATSHSDFDLQAHVVTTRNLTFLKDWGVLSDASFIMAGEVPESLTLTPNATHTKLTFHAVAAGQEVNSDFDLDPHTVVLPNFDPAGLQVLLNMQASAPAPDGNYMCLVPSGQGTMLPCTFTQAGAGSGTLDSKPLPLKHWLLKLGPVAMDVWANANGDLMLASVAAQNVAYTRTGFALDKQSAAAATPAAVEVPAYAVEREVTFPSDGLAVPGTLTLPRGARTRVPVAVLVQGSGVQDRDETVGANKEFQQLAWGLAQRGIATLRYDRRPKFALDNFLKHFDLDHEVVIDAASALAYAATVPEADPAHVFLIGHSLGAQLAPYIVQRRLAEKPGSVRGYVLLAGVQTPIDLTLERQIAEFGKAQGKTDAEVNEQVAKWRAAFVRVRDPRTPADKQEGVGFTAPTGYWRDWLARDPAAVMNTLPIPVLVLRGEFDRNVTHEDFLMLAAAATVPGSKSGEFPGLNHLFMPVSGLYADELLAGEIAPSVLDLISGWIHSLE